MAGAGLPPFTDGAAVVAEKKIQEKIVSIN